MTVPWGFELVRNVRFNDPKMTTNEASAVSKLTTLPVSRFKGEKSEMYLSRRSAWGFIQREIGAFEKNFSPYGDRDLLSLSLDLSLFLFGPKFIRVIRN